MKPTGSASKATYELIAFEAISSRPLELSIEQFTCIRKALSAIEAIVLIEESYDAILSNYRTFEKHQYELALEGVLDRSHGYLSMSEGRRTTALDLDNLLSTARSFLDITPRQLRYIGGQHLHLAFKEATSKEYDSNTSYQFMEALRNYAQHRGSSITGISWNRNRALTAEAGSKATLIHTVTPTIDSEELEKHFKAKRRHLLSDLADHKGRISVTPLVRSYLASLSSIMMAVRTAIADDESVAWATCQAAIASLSSEGAYGIRLRSYVDDAIVLDLSLPTSRDGLIHHLRSRNGALAHLPQTQVHR